MTIKELMEKHVTNVKINAGLARKIHHIKTVWVSDNSSFLTGGLIGVENLYFKSDLVNKFMHDIVGTVPEDIANDIKNTEVIKSKWKIVSEPMNLSLFYLMHLFENSDLSTKVKETVIYDLMSLFMLRSLSAKHSKGFTYLANRDVAKSTFENLSNRFLIKKHGSWLKVINHFIVTTLDSKYQFTIQKFEDSEEVKNMMSYCDRRVASTLTEIYSAYVNNLSAGSRLSTTSSEVSIGEDTYLKDVLNNPTSRIDQVLRKLIDDTDFLNKGVMEVSVSFSPSASTEEFQSLLESFQKDHLSKRVSNITTKTCVALHNYLESNDLYTNNLGDTVKAAKGLLISSRSSNRDIIEIKKETDKYINANITIKSKQARVSLRLALLIYIFIIFLTV